MAKRKTTKKSNSEGPAERATLAGTAIPAKYKAALQRATKSSIGAQLWDPQTEGDAIAGKIISATWRESGNGPYCSLILDAGEKSVMVRPGAVLSRQLQEQATKVGAEIVLVYRGSLSFGRGRPARLIAMEVVAEGDGDTIMDEERTAEMQAARSKRSAKRTKKVSKKASKR